MLIFGNENSYGRTFINHLNIVQTRESHKHKINIIGQQNNMDGNTGHKQIDLCIFITTIYKVTAFIGSVCFAPFT